MQAMLATTNGVAPVSWYGNTPWWRIALESKARRVLGDGLTVIERPGHLEYRVGLDVRGPTEPVRARIMFHADPSYNTYGLHPSDYPRVFAEPDRESKHRMPDGALCLYFPHDPPWRRWTADKGLLDLLDLTVDHLGYEDIWRATGGHNGGVWPGAEAEHGFTEEVAA